MTYWASLARLSLAGLPRAGLCICLGLLQGCALRPLGKQPEAPVTAISEARWQARLAQTQKIGSFSLQGRISDGRPGPSLDWQWQQRADGDYSVRLSGPLGAGALRIERSQGVVTVTDKDGAQTIDDPQAWMYAHLGWSVPVDALRLWVLGVPAPLPVLQMTLDEQGQLVTLQQADWLLEYRSYVPIVLGTVEAAAPDTVPTLALPTRLDAHQGETRLRILIDRWSGFELI